MWSYIKRCSQNRKRRRDEKLEEQEADIKIKRTETQEDTIQWYLIGESISDNHEETLSNDSVPELLAALSIRGNDKAYWNHMLGPKIFHYTPITIAEFLLLKPLFCNECELYNPFCYCKWNEAAKIKIVTNTLLKSVEQTSSSIFDLPPSLNINSTVTSIAPVVTTTAINVIKTQSKICNNNYGTSLLELCAKYSKEEYNGDNIVYMRWIIGRSLNHSSITELLTEVNEVKKVNGVNQIKNENETKEIKKVNETERNECNEEDKVCELHYQAKKKEKDKKLDLKMFKWIPIVSNECKQPSFLNYCLLREEQRQEKLALQTLLNLNVMGALLCDHNQCLS